MLHGVSRRALQEVFITACSWGTNVDIAHAIHRLSMHGVRAVISMPHCTSIGGVEIKSKAPWMSSSEFVGGPGSFGVIKESIFGFLVLWGCNSEGLTGPVSDLNKYIGTDCKYQFMSVICGTASAFWRTAAAVPGCIRTLIEYHTVNQ